MITPRLSNAASLLRGVRSYASVKSNIGATQVPMSNLESGKYINYQRIEDNLQIVRNR